MMRAVKNFVSAVVLLGMGCANAAGDAATNENSTPFDASAFDGPPTDGTTSESGTGDAGKDGAGSDSQAQCGPSTCSGCCNAADDCLPGTEDSKCGTGGVACVDCAGQGSICPGGSCLNCTPSCSGKPCNDGDGCGGMCGPGSGCCTPSCDGKLCGEPDDCSGVCAPGSGCCAPSCSGKLCGDSDGCGGTCSAGSGCCTPSCSGVLCGAADGCGGTCSAGSGCCTPSCSGVLCGASNGCGGTCAAGSGCCSPSCSGKNCGASDGCGGTCDGPCPGWEKCSNKQCTCGPSPNFKVVGGICLPSCGALLSALSLPNTGGGCCPNGCKAGTFGGGPGSTHDCNYCCSSSQPGVSTCL